MREKLMKLIASKHELLINLNTSIPNLFKLTEHLVENDVVQVVRCKDCENGYTIDGTGALDCCLHGMYVEPDDFCSYGEREER